MNAEGRERFFRSIAERIDADRVEEVHVFPAIRQGGRESGVAVLTLRPVEIANADEDASCESAVTSEEMPALEAVAALEPHEALDGSDESIGQEPEAEPEGESEAEPEAIDPPVARELEELMEAPEPAPAPAPPARRFTVLRAHYMLMLKGPDRGRWEVGVVEEAEAPAATVDEVVRGVHERAGGWGTEAPERLTGDDFRAALVEEPWTVQR